MNIKDRLRRRMHNLLWLVWAGERKDSVARLVPTPRFVDGVQANARFSWPPRLRSDLFAAWNELNLSELDGLCQETQSRKREMPEEVELAELYATRR